MTDQSSLRSFAASGDRRPMLHKDEAVGPINVESQHSLYPGYIGTVPSMDATGFLAYRDHPKDYNGQPVYAIPDKVLAYVRAKDVTRILIAEEDSSRVYAFHERQFDQRVPQKIKSGNEQDENQSMAFVDEHWGQWEDHAESVLLGRREVN
jgi:hypothetical protein